MEKSIYFVLIILICALLIVFGPFAIVWALNTLFALGIAYNFWTWLSVVILNLTWFSKYDFNKKIRG